MKGGDNSTATEYIVLEDIQIWEVVAVSIVWNEETRSSLRFIFYLSNKQQMNWEIYHTKDGCRRKIKSNLSLMYII